MKQVYRTAVWVVSVAVSMLVCRHVNAQQVRRVTLMPETTAQLLSGFENGVGEFDTPQAAFAAYKKYLADNCTTPYHCEVSNFRRGERGDLYWGNRLTWWHDYVITVNGQPYSSGTTGVVAEQFICPNGWQYNPNIKSGTGSDADPRHLEPYCYQDIPIQQCPEGSCRGQGDPIFPEDGTYRQTDADYVDPRGVLTFERHYNSNQRSMSSVLARGVLVPNPMLTLSPNTSGYTGNASFRDQNIGDTRTIVRTYRYINIAGVTGTRSGTTQGQIARPGGLFYDYNLDGTNATAASPSTHQTIMNSPQVMDFASSYTQTSLNW